MIDENVITINTDDMKEPVVGNDIYTSRENVYKGITLKNSKTASIVVQAYNRLEKTKYCVECILEYTKDIDFELILVDNGSSDGTYEYFQTVEYADKKIVKVTKNIGSIFPYLFYSTKHFKGRYLVGVANDVYVTTNWLSNLLKCIESDNKIGLVMPMSTNISNLQEVQLSFDSMDKMQEEAKKFNKSNPLKWKERLRLINAVTIYKREILDLVGTLDGGYFHDFSEDDYCIRLRRMGYKLILCEDTFVHHDHDFRNLEGKDPEIYRKSLEIGRQNFKDKYYGLDPWDDINNFEINLVGMLPKPEEMLTPFNILGIDVRCGSPILEIRNFLRKYDILNSTSSAFTTNAKYYLDLQTICNGDVYCDRIDYLSEKISPNSFDYIILGEPVNTYNEPIRLLNKMIEILKKDGKLLFKLRNSADIYMFLNLFGHNNSLDKDMPVEISVEDIGKVLEIIKVSKFNISADMHQVSQYNIKELKAAIVTTNLTIDIENTLNRILVKDYLLCVTK